MNRFERTIAERCICRLNLLWQREFFDAGAGEGVPVERGHAARNIDLLQMSRICGDIFRCGFHAVREGQLLDIGVTQRVIRIGDARGERQRGEVRAVFEGISADRSEAVGEPELRHACILKGIGFDFQQSIRQIKFCHGVAVIKSIISDLGDGFRNDDLRDMIVAGADLMRNGFNAVLEDDFLDIAVFEGGIPAADVGIPAKDVGRHALRNRQLTQVFAAGDDADLKELQILRQMQFRDAQTVKSVAFNGLNGIRNGQRGNGLHALKGSAVNHGDGHAFDRFRHGECRDRGFVLAGISGDLGDACCCDQVVIAV